jgi:hypothetical protein
VRYLDFGNLLSKGDVITYKEFNITNELCVHKLIFIYGTLSLRSMPQAAITNCSSERKRSVALFPQRGNKGSVVTFKPQVGFVEPKAIISINRYIRTIRSM